MSPKEEEWLEEEINSGNHERVMRAVRTREFVMRSAKHEIGSELGLLRRILGLYTTSDSQSGADDSAPQKKQKRLIRDLLWLATKLSEDDPSLYLAQLATAGIIDQKVIPVDWSLFYDPPKTKLEASLRWGRSPHG